jgi:hypothetical protein
MLVRQQEPILPIFSNILRVWSALFHVISLGRVFFLSISIISCAVPLSSSIKMNCRFWWIVLSLWEWMEIDDKAFIDGLQGANGVGIYWWLLEAPNLIYLCQFWWIVLSLFGRSTVLRMLFVCLACAFWMVYCIACDVGDLYVCHFFAHFLMFTELCNFSLMASISGNLRSTLC